LHITQTYQNTTNNPTAQHKNTSTRKIPLKNQQRQLEENCTTEQQKNQKRALERKKRRNQT
jgi:hypothetical protein